MKQASGSGLKPDIPRVLNERPLTGDRQTASGVQQGRKADRIDCPCLYGVGHLPEPRLPSALKHTLS